MEALEAWNIAFLMLGMGEGGAEPEQKKKKGEHIVRERATNWERDCPGTA